MSDIISNYQRWKQEGEDLRAKAKQAIEARFREVLLEAVQLAEEYKHDFGKPLTPPSPVTSFKYKAVVRTASKSKPASKEAPPQASRSKSAAPAPNEKPDPAVTALTKKLAAARKKLEAARAAGRPTKNFEDRVYEVEDELRLAQK